MTSNSGFSLMPRFKYIKSQFLIHIVFHCTFLGSNFCIAY